MSHQQPPCPNEVIHLFHSISFLCLTLLVTLCDSLTDVRLVASFVPSRQTPSLLDLLSIPCCPSQESDRKRSDREEKLFRQTRVGRMGSTEPLPGKSLKVNDQTKQSSNKGTGTAEEEKAVKSASKADPVGAKSGRRKREAELLPDGRLLLVIQIRR